MIKWLHKVGLDHDSNVMHYRRHSCFICLLMLEMHKAISKHKRINLCYFNGLPIVQVTSNQGQMDSKMMSLFPGLSGKWAPFNLSLLPFAHIGGYKFEGSLWWLWIAVEVQFSFFWCLDIGRKKVNGRKGKSSLRQPQCSLSLKKCIQFFISCQKGNVNLNLSI